LIFFEVMMEVNQLSCWDSGLWIERKTSDTAADMSVGDSLLKASNMGDFFNG